MESFKHNPFMINPLSRIDLSIQKGPDLYRLLKSSIPAYLGELNCEEGWVFKVNRSWGLTPDIEQVYPAEIYNHRPLTHITLFRNFLLLFDKHIGSSFNRKFPLSGKLTENVHFNMFHLKGFGYLVLLKRNGDLGEEIMESLEDVNSKLAIACIYAEKNLGISHSTELSF